MAVYIHREKRFNKLLEGLRKGSQEAALASVRTDAIIRDLTTTGKSGLQMMEKRTKNGELRINKCLKYDLGSGYRMICIEHGQHLIVTYVGTHDDCDRWIENNRKFDPDIDSECTDVRPDDFCTESRCPHHPEKIDEADYDEILMKKIDDNLLREIFCGLCKEVP